MKTTWRATVLSGALLAAGAITGIVHATDSVTDLGTLPFGTLSNAFAINDAGQVCGQATASGFSANHACVWAGGPAQDLGTLPGGSNSVALDINNVGQMCGFSDGNVDGVNATWACTWGGGGIQALPPLPGLTDGEARGINDQGQVCGDSYGVDGGLFEQGAVVWTGGAPQELPPLPGDAYSVGYGINNQGQVCGISYGGGSETHPCVWTNGVPTELARPAGVDTAIALGINDAGQVCGYSYTDVQHALLWTNGQPQELPAFPGGAMSTPSYGSINRAGVVAGVAEGVLNGVTYQHACVWVGGKIQDLGALPNSSKPLGVSAANGINNTGQACGNSNPGRANHAALFTVGIADVTPPAINTPPNATADTEPGKCSASVNPGQATAVDDVDGPVAVTGTRSDGKPLTDPYSGGVTQITWSARDAAGNASASVQTVTVTDREKPVLTLPQDIDTSTDPNACVSNVRAGTATATDNCGTVLVSGVRSDGLDLSQPYPVGKTLVTWTATDPTGNSASGVQTINVAARSSVVLTVPPDKKATTDPGKCSAAIDPGTATATDPCPGLQVTGTRSDGKALSDPYPVGTTQITWTATDIYGNTASGTQSVAVADGEKPAFGSVTDLSVQNDAGKCSASVTLAQPPVTDNCGVSNVVATRADGKGLSDAFPVGQTVVTWTATDAAGNTATATQTVTVTDGEKPVLTVGSNLTAVTDAGKCSASVAVNSARAADNCGAVQVNGVRSDGQALSAAYPAGVTTITWTATDTAGNTAMGMQTVTVSDGEKPVVTAPQNLAVNTDPGKCSATVQVGQATASDNCGVASLTGARSDGKSLSDPYPVGQTMVTWTATDAAGNTASAMQTVTVTDGEAPVLSAVTNLAANADAGKCSASVTLAAPTATDNCGAAQVSGVRSDGKAITDAYPVGVTTVTWTAADAAGNTATTVQTVTVKDANPPVISGVSASPNQIFPPNHLMVPITLSYTVTDGCDSNPTVTLSITSNEAANQVVDGDGDDGVAPLPAEWQIVDAHHVMVRADRSGEGTGRVYFITITATDHSGNSSSTVVTVTVPKSRKK